MTARETRSKVNVCANCRFFLDPPAHDEYEHRGECRRHAPQVVPHGLKMLVRYAADRHAKIYGEEESPNESEVRLDEDIESATWPAWPRVAANEWCGEFELASPDA